MRGTHESLTTSDYPESDQTGLSAEQANKILESESAQNTLPYLTLGKLNRREMSNILALADESISAIEQKRLPKNTSGFERFIEDTIADLANEHDAWQDGHISPKLAQARKLFCASLFDATNRSDNPQATAWNIYGVFFGSSPDITSYCGGLKGSLELLTVAERTPKNPCSREIYDELIYAHSFTDHNEFETIINDSTPIQQLRLLPIFENIARQCSPENYSRTALNNIIHSLEELDSDDNTKPLVRMAAQNVVENLKAELELDDSVEWVFLDENNPEHAELLRKDREAHSQWQKKQDEKHRQYPSLPNDRVLVDVAPGMAATVVNGGIDMISDLEGHTASLLDYSKENPFGIDKESAQLLAAVHGSRMVDVISKELDVDLVKIPIDAQIQLLKFMTEADGKRFDKLCDTMHHVDEKLRAKLAENFVAADFGEDFGDSLLTIAGSERLSNKEKERILDEIGSCRESIRKITGLYEGVDGGKFTHEYARAANERLTDAISVFEQIARNGSAEADLGWPGRMKYDYDAAMEALQYETKSLKIINGVMGDLKERKEGTFAEVVLHPEADNQRLNRTVYNFYSPRYGYVMLYTRPEGSHSFDPMTEYGKIRSRYDKNSVNAGVEASISFVVNPIDSFFLPSPFKSDPRALKNPRFYDTTTMDKVSAIRLDREGRAPGASADDSERDPINPIGMVSVDLAAINDRVDTPSGKIARLFATGNALRAMRSGAGSALNHNTKWFEQDKYGTARGFAGLVGYIDSEMLDLVKNCPPGAGEGFTAMMRQSSRKRGGAAMRAAKTNRAA